MTKFRDRYRIESTRLSGWDYAGAGWYFVTLCTRNHTCFFGDVVDGVMHLSPIGEIVAEEWQKTPLIRPNVRLDEWVIMPNHLHGIIIIEPVETSRRDVSTTTTPSRLKAGSLGAIIGQVKSICTKRIWAIGYTDFAWQTRFYDHIIRNESSLKRIREYIVNNPAEWKEDRYYAGNLSL
jgi:putative transposase